MSVFKMMAVFSFCCFFIVVGSVFAGENMPTVNDLRNAQMKKALAEIEKAQATETSAPKRASQMPGTYQQTSPPSATVSKKKKEILLIAVYGVEQDLSADIAYNGVVFPVKPLDIVSGWTVRKIYPTRLILKKKSRVKEIMLSMRPEKQAAAAPPAGYYPAIPPTPMP